jgi:Tfp pilus assembly protein PilF
MRKARLILAVPLLLMIAAAACTSSEPTPTVEQHADNGGVSTLAEALEAIQEGDLEAATHEIEHFIESASGEYLFKAEEVLALLREGDLHEAEHALEELMGLVPHTD